LEQSLEPLLQLSVESLHQPDPMTAFGRKATLTWFRL
jgi:hypothetical protein